MLAAAPAWATFPGANGRIAYLTDTGEFHTVLPSGKGDKSLPNGVAAPAWSPNGQRIAGILGVGQPNRTQIYSMTVEGRDLRRLTHGPRNDANPSYSPSGHRILFTRTRNAGPIVMTMHSDGSNLRALGQGVASEWSPDGKWIAYVVGSTPKRRPSIWVMQPDGKDKHRLLYLGTNGGTGPRYAPDGRHFLFSRCSDYGCHEFLARADGSHVHPAPCDEGGTYIGAYSPDGRWFLAGVLNAHGGVGLARVSVSSCGRQEITGSSTLYAAWQPLPAP